MTLVDIKNALFSHFMSDSVFTLADDIASLGLDDKELGPALAPHREALVKAGLDDFARVGILLEVSTGTYILTQPISVMTQQVILSPLAAEMVADLVNEFTDGPYQANKLGITTTDIERLCGFCHFLLDEDTMPQSSP